MKVLPLRVRTDNIVMRKIFHTCFVLLAATLMLLTLRSLSSPNNFDKNWQLMVLSDVHLLAPELIGNTSSHRFDNSQKLLAQSQEILDSVSARVMRIRPNVIFITGDLTKDGELASHRLLVGRYLSVWRQAGIKIYVIPGNHDINNPLATSYANGRAERTATISPHDFAALYGAYGYGDAIARDAASLSYVAQLRPGLRLLALDACRYDDNDFKTNTNVTGGRLKPQTVEFIKRQVAAAKADGDKVIAMIHHGVVPHFSMEKELFPQFLVKDNDRVAELLQQMGIKVVFTGHFHAEDAASQGTLTDVETGSTVSYPTPFRLISVKSDTMNIATNYIKHIASLEKKGRTVDGKTTSFVFHAATKMVKAKLPAHTPHYLTNAIGQELGEAYLCHLHGDEHPSKAWQDRMEKSVQTLSKTSPKMASKVKHIATSLTTDSKSPDNRLRIVF